MGKKENMPSIWKKIVQPEYNEMYSKKYIYTNNAL